MIRPTSAFAGIGAAAAVLCAAGVFIRWRLLVTAGASLALDPVRAHARRRALESRERHRPRREPGAGARRLGVRSPLPWRRRDGAGRCAVRHATGSRAQCSASLPRRRWPPSPLSSGQRAARPLSVLAAVGALVAIAGIAGASDRRGSRRRLRMGENSRIRSAVKPRRERHGDPDYLGQAAGRHVGRVRAHVSGECDHEGKEHQGAERTLAGAGLR